MADDKLIFPIYFDLEKGVKDAGGEWDKKYAKRLEDLIAKRPINVKLKLDPSKLDDLDAVKKRLAELKIEPITPETKTAIKELAAELRTLAKALEQVQKYSARAGGTPEAVRNSRIAVNEERAKAQAALAAQRAARAEYNLAAARDKDALAATRGITATQNLNREYKAQDGYISRLIKRLAVYAGFSAIGNFLTNVREVTAEFELQRVSLGAIIQDQTRANQLFSEIKQYALQSPVKILDLTKYTKQLAAYKIGVDELFETTKKLTDVSVGLGVSMERIVLFYGQVRAKGYLTAQDLKQATEAGIPLTEEIAKNLSAVNGELVTAGQVMDMISKRQITFEQVKEVFDDMTSAGGMFYNMQEKQGNTLYGMWQKLGDAAAMMYDEIGNTTVVNNAMRGVINVMRTAMKNWREYGIVLGATALYLGLLALKTKSVAMAKAAMSVETKKYIASLNVENLAFKRNILAQGEVTRWQRIRIAMNNAAVASNIKAATSTNVLTRSFYQLKAAMMSNPWGLIITAVTTLALEVYNLLSQTNKLDRELSDIEDKYAKQNIEDEANFKKLAKQAIENANGSKAQKEALDELNRTYGKILGSEALELESLKKLGGEYQELIQIIEIYNAKRKHEERESAIKEDYATRIEESKTDLIDYLEAQGLTSAEATEAASNYIRALGEGISGEQAKAELEKYVKEHTTFVGDLYRSLFMGGYLTAKKAVNIYQADFQFPENELIDLTNKQTEALEKEQQAYLDAIDTMAQYQGAIERLSQRLATQDFGAGRYTIPEFESIDGAAILKFYTPGQFGSDIENNIEETNAKIAAQLGALVKILDGENIEINEAWFQVQQSVADGAKGLTKINFDEILKTVSGNDSPTKQQAIVAIKEIKAMYDELAPSDETVRVTQLRLRQIASEMGVSFKSVNSYLMKNDQNLKDYRKSLGESIDGLKEKIKQLAYTRMKLMAMGDFAEAAEVAKQIAKTQRLERVLSKQWRELPNFDKTKKHKQDNRLSQLNKIEQTLTKINQKYEELLKKEGQTKALADIQKIYGDTLDYVNQLGEKFNLNFAMPTDFKSLQDYRKAILNVIETLKVKGYEKAAIELQAKIGTGDVDQLSKQIEQRLKELSDKISRTKTAKEFYERILNTTGDYELAANVSMSIYGSTGTELQQQLAQQITDLFGSYEVEVPVGIITPDNMIDYKALQEYADNMVDKQSDLYKELSRIAKEGIAGMAKTYEGYLKDLEKAKTYSDKRIELARDTANKITEIEKTIADAQKRLASLRASGKTDDETNKEIQRLEAIIKSYESLPQQYKEREDKEAAKLEYEAFKNSALYVQMFEDLDHASTSALTRMRDRLIDLKSQWQNLDPTQLKELQSRLKEIDTQIAARNPFKALADAFKKYRDLRKSGRTQEGDELKADEAEKARKEAEAKMLADEATYKALAKLVGAESLVAKAARKVADKSKEAYDAAEKTANETAEMANDWKAIYSQIDNANQKIDDYQAKINEALDGVRKMLEAFGTGDEDLQFFDDIVSSLNEIVDAGQQAATSVKAFMQGQYFTAITSAVSAIGGLISGFTNLFNAGKIRKANKEIKKQQELLEQLEYSYKRLQAAADKLFGTNYISNFNAQIKTMEAQREAYLKQAMAEESKGKKADAEKIKEYTKQAQEIEDQIKDLTGELVAKFTGSSRQDAARQFAQSWFEARASFASTKDAIMSDYRDLIKNMIIEGAAAKIVDTLLGPVYEQMEEQLRNENIYGAIDTLLGGVDKFVDKADKGLETLYKELQARGYDMSKILSSADSSAKGIAREFATASEESVNGLASMYAVETHYTSHLPTIAANTEAISAYVRFIAENRESERTVIADNRNEWQDEAMTHLASIDRHTAETVAECQKIAKQCAELYSDIHRTITYGGRKPTSSISVTISN